MQIFSFKNTLVASFEEYKSLFSREWCLSVIVDFHEDMMKQFFSHITRLYAYREQMEKRIVDYKTTFDILMKQQIVMERKMEMMMNDIERLTAKLKKQEEDEKHCEKMATYNRLKKELAEIEKELESTTPNL